MFCSQRGIHFLKWKGEFITFLLHERTSLNSIMGTNVQMVFKDKLQKSDDFWLEAGLQKHLSLRRIFGIHDVTEVRTELSFSLWGLI